MKLSIVISIAVALSLSVAPQLHATPPTDDSAASLVETLEKLQSKVSIAEIHQSTLDYKADLDSDINGQYVAPDDSALIAAYNQARADAKQACANWLNKSKPAKTAKIIYCNIWQSTLVEAGRFRHGNSTFEDTQAGAQYMRAKAEFLATDD